MTDQNGMETKEMALSKPAPPQQASLYLRLVSNLFYTLERAVGSVSGSSSGKRGRLNPYLNGNFAPVQDELFDDQLVVVEGSLPAAVNGVFLRTGPNPALPVVGGYHWCAVPVCAVAGTGDLLT